MPRFHVRDGFPITDKSTFVLAGFVIEGELTEGMVVRMPFNLTVMITAKIDAIQHVRRPDGDVVGLSIRCDSAQELALWDAMKLKDRVVEITQAT